MAIQKLFISYSRRDQNPTRRLYDTLEQRGYDAWVDWQDIPVSSDWWLEITRAIDTRDVVLAVMSVESLASEICNREITYAREHNKRIIPIILEDFEIRDVVGQWFETQWEDNARANWVLIKTLNWVFFREDDDYDSSVVALVRAIDFDQEHVRTHTRLLTRAVEWDTNQRRSDFLLGGEELQEAENWLRRALDKNPEPDELHHDFINTSRKADDERQAMLSAMRRQTSILRRASVILGIVGVLALAATVFSFFQINNAQDTLIAVEATGTSAAGTQVAALGEAEEAIERAEQLQSESERQRQRADSLRFASEADDARQDGDPDLVAVALAIESHKLVENVTDIPIRAQGILADIVYSPGLVRYFSELTVDDLDSNLDEFPSLLAHGGQVEAVAQSPDGTRIVSVSHDGSIKIWAEDGELLNTLIQRPDDASGRWRVLSVAYSPDGSMVASGDAEGTIAVWDAETGDELLRLEVSTRSIRALAFSPDSTQLLSGDFEGQLILWDVVNGEEVESFPVHTSAITSVAFGPDGKLFASADSSGKLVFWNADTKQPLYIETRAHQDSAIRSLAFTKDSSMMLSGADDETFIRWQLDDFTFTRFEDARFDNVTGLAVSDDGHYAYVGTVAGDVHIWDLEFGAQSQLEFEMSGFIRTLSTSAIAEVSDIALLPNGDELVAAYSDGSVILWDLVHGAEELRLREVNAVISEAIYTDSGLITAIDKLGNIFLWNTTTETVTPLTNQDFYVSASMLFPNGLWMLAQEADSEQIVVVDVRSREVLRTYDHNLQVANTVFNSDGSLALSYPSGITAQNSAAFRRVLWDTSTGNIISTLGLGDNTVSIGQLSLERSGYSFNADNTRIAVIDPRQTAGSRVHVFDATTGVRQYSIQDEAREYTSVALHPTEPLLLIGYQDGGLEIVDADGSVRNLRGHTDVVNSVNFDDSGTIAIAGSGDGLVIIWDVASAEVLRRFPTATSGVRGVDFVNFEYGQGAIAFSDDGTITVWRLDEPDEVVSFAQENRFLRPFTCNERRLYQVLPFCSQTPQ